MNIVSEIGRRTLRSVDEFGDFCRFSGRTLAWVVESGLSRRNLGRIVPQFFEIGTKSVPVVIITGIFVGMVLAVQAVQQFKAVGMVAAMGTIVNLSVLRELGPVLAGVILAGRVGGGLTAELGTMRVTEQLDALRAMGAVPIRVLVVPRFLACILLIPVLVIYADFMGILGGYIVSVYVYGVSGGDFWRSSQDVVMYYDIFYGPIKSIFFGASMGLICCYKGFRCAAGAAGVGRACTEAFVASCMAIITLDFFLGMLMNTIQEMMFGLRHLL